MTKQNNVKHEFTAQINVNDNDVEISLILTKEAFSLMGKVLDTTKLFEEIGSFNFKSSLYQVDAYNPEDENPIEISESHGNEELDALVTDISRNATGGLSFEIGVGYWISTWLPDLSDTIGDDSFRELDKLSISLDIADFA